MTGLGGLNTSAQGVALGLVQLQLPVVKTQADLVAPPTRKYVGPQKRPLVPEQP